MVNESFIPKNMKKDEYIQFIKDWNESTDKSAFHRNNSKQIDNIYSHWNNENTKWYNNKELKRTTLEKRSKKAETQKSKAKYNKENRKRNKANLNRNKDKKSLESDKIKKEYKSETKNHESKSSRKSSNNQKPKIQLKQEYRHKYDTYKNKDVKKIGVMSKSINFKAEEDIAKLIGSKELLSYEKSILSLNKKFKALSTFHKAGSLMAIGGVIGVTKRAFKSEEKKEKTSPLIDGAVGMGVAGLGVFALDKKSAKYQTKKTVVDNLKKASSMGNKELQNLTGEAKKMYEVGRMKGVQNSYLTKNSQKFVKRGLGASALFIATTSLIDSGLNSKYKKDAEKQNKKDEKRIEEMQKKKNQKNQMPIIGPPGDLVFDMWNDRMGHTNMGNSKYK